MPDQPHSWAMRLMEQAGYAWLVLLALWGGVSSYVKRITETGTPFRIIELTAQLVISGFCGVVTIYFCEHMGWGIYTMGAAAGLAGYMGTSALDLAESMIKRRLGK